MKRDWSLLPPELLQAFAEKIVSHSDYIRFRAVCHSWRSASSPRPLHLPPQLPWLMLSYERDGNDFTRLFYDLSLSKVHRLDLPETQGANICGSWHGWLVLCKDLVLSLLNPITRATIPLPPVTVPPANIGLAPRDWQDDVPFFEKWDADNYVIHPANFFGFVKAILTSCPLDPSCLVLLSVDSFWQLAFCRIGDQCWTVIEFTSDILMEPDIVDFTYSNGCLYSLNQPQTLTVYDLNNCSRAILKCNNDICLSMISLVEGVNGDILLFCGARPTYVDGVLVTEIKYALYKVSFGEEAELIEVRDTDQNVLFVADYHQAISFSSANMQLEKWGPNCLFYDFLIAGQHVHNPHNHKIILIRLDDGTVTEITEDLGLFQCYEGWSKPLWLTPSLL